MFVYPMINHFNHLLVYIYFISVVWKQTSKQSIGAMVSLTEQIASMFLGYTKPNFYIVKLEFTGVYIIFLISAQKT